MEIKKLKIIYKDSLLTLEYFFRKGNENIIVFLHGGACSKNDFIQTAQLEELKTYTLMSFDYPGCGNSLYPDHIKLNIDDLIEIAHIVISKLNLKNITLIGHSTGGLISLLYILKYGNIHSFINVEGNLHPDNCNFSRKVISQDFTTFINTGRHTLLESLKQSKNYGFIQWAKTIEQFSSLCAFYNICPSLVQYSDNPNTLERYNKLKIPKLYIYGSENKTDLSFLKDLESEIAEISKSNHFPFYDNPKEYYKVVSDFILKNTVPRY